MLGATPSCSAAPRAPGPAGDRFRASPGPAASERSRRATPLLRVPAPSSTSAPHSSSSASFFSGKSRTAST
eukprot:746482-Alexandrium_andersonii.AAC.1